MMEYRGELIVGGFFMSAGEAYAPKIARWDGNTWHSMGFGMTGPVYALCQYNGWLYAAGSFQYAGTKICNSIARWGERGWEPVGTGTSGGSGEIFSLCVYNGEMWAGGSFLYMDGVPAKNIAKYNGTVWSTAGQGASGINCVFTGGYITAMKEYNQQLYVTGAFTSMDGQFANKIAKYNGSFWCPVEFGADLRPRALEVYDGSLIVSGDFYSISGREFGNIASCRFVPKVTQDNIGSKKEKAALSQNYPNPFNPTTHIKFEIPLSGGVDAEGGRGVLTKLAVYDILGKEVAVVVNESLEAGKYDYEFNAGNLPSGVYFYKLIAGNYTDVKRMLLVK
jgi:hypothetical protein